MRALKSNLIPCPMLVMVLDRVCDVPGPEDPEVRDAISTLLTRQGKHSMMVQMRSPKVKESVQNSHEQPPSL